MPAAAMPPDEDARIATLLQYRILDTQPDPRTDVFVMLAADVCDAPISIVSLIDRDRQWFKAAIGVDVCETPRNVAFCAHAILTPTEVMVVEDATLDPRFADNELVVPADGHRFYAGAPILSPEGHPLGTLCVIDKRPRTLDEPGRRRLKGLAAGVASVLEMHRNADKLRHSATHDLLTGLANRALFEPAWDEAVQQAATEGTPCAIICLDLDRFKQINDRFGHDGGDTVLKAAATRLQDSIRSGDMAVRLGGDEFAVLMAGTSDPEVVRQIANRIVKAFAEPLEIDGQPVAIRTSIGFAIAPTDGDAGSAVMRLADAALYRAKNEGRGFVVWHGDSKTDKQVSAANLLNDLRAAIHAGSFTLNWQPYYDLASGDACGQEALIRWDRPGHGKVSPEVFIAAAEESDLIVEIDAWVLMAACREAAGWPGGQTVSVNVSPAMFGSRNFVPYVAKALRETGLAPHRLVLEITERTSLERNGPAATHFEGLHRIGVRMALDDFGSGHTSIGYLQRFEFDSVKLDRSLVENIDTASRSRMALSGMIFLARSIGMKVCAEGIETQVQLDFLREAQCDMAQGYLMGRPTAKPVFGRIEPSQTTD